MDFAERRRSRKSQSFKLINEEDSELRCLDGPGGIGVNGGVKDIAMAEAWFGDDGMEIKKQITGMMRMLNDKAARVYQRAGEEADTLKCEPQDLQVCCVSPDGSQQEEPQHSNWSLETTARSLAVGQYGTRSKTVKMKDPEGSVKVAAPLAEPPEPSCCTCSCKNTLQAILLELRAVRKLLQAQNGAQEKHLKAPSAFSPSRPPIPRRRPCLRWPLHKMAPLAPSRSSSPADCMTSESRRGTERSSSETFALEHLDQPSQSLPAQPEQLPPSASNSVGQFSLHREQPPAEPEVQLAEDYDVYIPKSQLDSILVNYTRSGSLLFRKLVCAFFDDATLATSLPNGKRKRGLNDNRKGLDQNIVGAIKVFTEKYCTANRIQKLPGPRDWVQILQDQIKLARRRLKRAEAADGGAVFGRMSTPTPGQDFKTSATPNNDA